MNERPRRPFLWGLWHVPRDIALGFSGGTPLSYLLVLLRLVWYAGWSREVESVAEAKARGSRAAQILAELAADRGRVVFFGHGVFDRFVAASLLRSGWRGARVPSTSHWSSSTYEYARGVRQC